MTAASNAMETTQSTEHLSLSLAGASMKNFFETDMMIYIPVTRYAFAVIYQDIDRQWAMSFLKRCQQN